MKKHRCCNADTGLNYSYVAALGILALGYLSNIFASMISHVSLNLLYWWVTAFLVFASFQISPGRFFRLDQVVKGSFFVPVAVLLACFLPLQVFPQLAQYFLWRVMVGYIVSAGFWFTMMQLYQFKQPIRIALWGEGHFMWLGSGIMVAIASMRNSPALLLCTLTGLVLAQVRQMMYEVTRREGKSQLNLAGSLTLAMGMSWGYSFIRLAAASWSMSAMHSLFFCDCWKTMGVVMLADKMRFRVKQSSTSGDQIDGVLGHMIPLVLGLGYVASTFWAVALPSLGWGLPMRVFATVLVSACPCVITLAAPLVDFFESKLARLFDQAWQNSDASRDRCLQRNLSIVRVYYLLSMFLSSGGSYLLTGVWMSPWTAGLLMMAGQGVLVAHTSTFMFNAYAQASNQSAWVLLYHLYRRSVDGRLLAANNSGTKSRHVLSDQIDLSRGNNDFAGNSESNKRTTSCCASKRKSRQGIPPADPKSQMSCKGGADAIQNDDRRGRVSPVVEQNCQVFGAKIESMERRHEAMDLLLQKAGGKIEDLCELILMRKEDKPDAKTVSELSPQPMPVIDMLVPSGEVKKVNHGSLLNCGTDPGDATKRSHDDVCSSGVRGTSLFDHEASSKVQSDNAELAEGKVSKKSGAGGSGKSSKSLRGTDYKSKSMETNYRLTKNWRGKGKKSKDSSAQLREADPQAVSASRK